MSLSLENLFFPILTRRKEYATESMGEYYKDYTKYRQEIREDCLGRCVYCDRHENEIGGQEEMEIDHFRPKEKYKDPSQSYYYDPNVPDNFVWSCHKCNNKKSNIWPAFGTNKTFTGHEGFIDPFQENRQDYLKILANGELQPLKAPANYIIERLLLNRVGLKKQRQKRLLAFQLLQKLNQYLLEIHKELQENTEIDELLSYKIEFEQKIRQLLETDLDFTLHPL